MHQIKDQSVGIPASSINIVYYLTFQNRILDKENRLKLVFTQFHFLRFNLIARFYWALNAMNQTKSIELLSIMFQICCKKIHFFDPLNFVAKIPRAFLSNPLPLTFPLFFKCFDRVVILIGYHIVRCDRFCARNFRLERLHFRNNNGLCNSHSLSELRVI